MTTTTGLKVSRNVGGGAGHKKQIAGSTLLGGHGAEMINTGNLSHNQERINTQRPGINLAKKGAVGVS